jgi:glycosyltransferase involved in cell wall biosynthesis
MTPPSYPELFILIPCYNDFEGLVTALKSIRFDAGRFLPVIVDDGSQPPLADALLRKELGEMPFHLIRMPRNVGITRALNAGLEWILEQPSCRYIARLDCGDICDYRRFQMQTEYLDRHPGIGLLGSWSIFKEQATGISYTYRTPTRHDAIIKEMPLRNVFIHPSVMFRPDLVQKAGWYPEAYPFVEDYALFWRMLTISKGAILPEYLVTCAVSGTGISLSNRRKQLIGRKKVIQAFAEQNFAKRLGLIKINFLMLLPKPLLLRLKSLISKN